MPKPRITIFTNLHLYLLTHCCRLDGHLCGLYYLWIRTIAHLFSNSYESIQVLQFTIETGFKITKYLQSDKNYVDETLNA